MKVTMEMTVDGLVRALRWKALELAERAQDGYLPIPEEPAGRQEARRHADRREGDGYDRGRG